MKRSTAISIALSLENVSTIPFTTGRSPVLIFESAVLSNELLSRPSNSTSSSFVIAADKRMYLSTFSRVGLTIPSVSSRVLKSHCKILQIRFQMKCNSALAPHKTTFRFMSTQMPTLCQPHSQLHLDLPAI